MIFKIVKRILRRWSQDGGIEGSRVHVSSQLGQLLGTGQGPRTPKGTGGTPMWASGTWGVGKKRSRSGRDQGLWGVVEGDERFPQLEWPTDCKGVSGGRERTFTGWEDQKATWPAFPLPPWAPRSSLGSQPEPLLSKARSSGAEPKPHPCHPRTFPSGTGPEPRPPAYLRPTPTEDSLPTPVAKAFSFGVFLFLIFIVVVVVVFHLIVVVSCIFLFFSKECIFLFF